MLDLTLEFSLILRLLVAVGLGAVIGLEREYTKHEAGLRTLMLVSLGSCGFMLMGYLATENISGAGLATPDPTRVAQGIITGVGFLGAGVIIKEGLNIKGLTTAATIWVSASIGVAVAAELFVVAFSTTILAVLILLLFSKLEGKMGIKYSKNTLMVTGKDTKALQNMVMQELRKAHVNVTGMSLQRKNGAMELRYEVNLPLTVETTMLTHDLSVSKDISGVEWNT